MRDYVRRSCSDSDAVVTGEVVLVSAGEYDPKSPRKVILVEGKFMYCRATCRDASE